MMAINFFLADAAPSVDPSSSTRSKRDAEAASTASTNAPSTSLSGTNAFAATLATVINTPMNSAPARKKDDPNSDLDASAFGVDVGAGPVVNTGTGSEVDMAVGPNVNTAVGPNVNVGVGSQVNIDASSGATTRVGPGVEMAVTAGANDGKPAFAAAAEARAAAAGTPVDSANSDSDALNPDFRARLGRVITRMHDEYGKDVQLVEGFRTQSRQDFLYDQGRTRPGNVVTWTKSSKHTLGLAADV
ncbi:MAG TPA: M15 family metallopeptidase, partial [Gemmatimonadaceae bacterium]